MKKRIIELLLLAVSLCLTGAQAPAQTPPADQTQSETAPKPEANTGPVKIIAGVLLVGVIAIIVLRRKGKKKTEEEF
jgi:hypothetical protein